MDKPNPPFLGAAYYPEAWPLEQIDPEIELMKSAGMNVMRIGEFAWHRMEPREGEFDFAWLHTVVDKLAAAGIATILGTPTATPPAWLTSKHPEVLFVMDDGNVIPHGGRRHYCPHNAVYREYCTKIVTRMGQEFGKHSHVIGWQIDNEVSYYRRPCSCDVCVGKFRAMLKERFGTIQKLNDAWGLELWSQAYDSFEQLPAPRRDIWHHPSLLQAWAEFGSDAYVDFVRFQADILHKLTKQPVGTDMMCTGAVDYFDIHQSLDVVQHNHYHFAADLWQAGFWFDFCRPLRPSAFWNTETATCWNGATACGPYKDPGFCRANSWLPIAFGGEANLYWLWRQHRTGQELMHGAVIDSHARPMHIFDEVKEVAAGFRAAGEFLNNTRPTSSGLAIHFSNRAQTFFEFQPLVDKFDFRRTLMERIYRPLAQAQFRPDVLHPGLPLDGVRLLLSPFLPMLDEYGLRERLKAWIEAGGTWIAGPFADIRDLHGGKFPAAPFGSLEEWGGVRTKYSIPGESKEFSLRFADGRQRKASQWFDGFEPTSSEVLACYAEGPLVGLAAATVKPMGRGRVILLGTVLSAPDFISLIKQVGREMSIAPVADASENLYAIPRDGAAGSGMVAVEVENRAAHLTLSRPATDVLTGKEVQGRLVIEPYGVRVLRF